MKPYDYASLALIQIVDALENQGREVLNTTASQAWDVFIAHIRLFRTSPLAQEYATSGVWFRDNFSAIWSFFQQDFYKAVMDL